MSDLRFALRGLVRRPLAAAVAVATLSLGLASVTALFAVTDAVILQPVGERDSRLVRVWKDDVVRGSGILFPISYPEYLVWEDEATGFDAIAAINYADGAAGAIMIDDEPVTANMVRASAGLLNVVGARPAYGRLLEPDDDVEGAELVAVVSHRFWRRVSGDPAFVGQRLSPPGDTPMTIVGVLHPTWPIRWTPISGCRWFRRTPATPPRPWTTPGPAVPRRGTARAGRLHRPGAGRAGGHPRAAERGVSGGLPRMPIVATPLVDTVVGHVRPTILLLLAGAALVFLVAGRTSPSCC